MSRFGLRCRAKFVFPDGDEWFADKALVGELADALLATDLVDALTFAGSYGEEKAVKGGAAALKKAIAPGKAGTYSALDAKQLASATVHTSWLFEPGALEIQFLVVNEALAARRKTILDTAQTFMLRVIDAVRPHGALLTTGHVVPEGRPFKYPRPRPPVVHPTLKLTSLLDVFDGKFHGSGLEDADRESFDAITKAPVPAYATRTQHGDGFVVLRWLDGPVDEQSAAIAAGRHARWLARVVPSVQRSPEYNEHGDANETPPQRQPRPPFTFFDPAKGHAYKAIIVDPSGEPDDEVWDEMVAAAKVRPGDINEIRLVVPLRELAVKILDRARHNGMGAVLYPDAQNRLWNIAPAGWWIDDEDPEPRGSTERQRS
jgi:hypothetical protein